MRFDGGVFDVWCMFIYPVQSATWCSRCGLMVVCSRCDLMVVCSRCDLMVVCLMCGACSSTVYSQQPGVADAV